MKKVLIFLVKNKAKVIKLASIDARNYHFCTYIAKTGIPTVISTGMCNYDEILRTKLIFDQFNCPVMFLHCASSYPSSLKDKNLNCIPILQNLLETDIGFSGHGIGYEGTIGAVALGSKVIEKHVTFNKEMSGPDHAASLDFKQFKSLIELSNNVYECLGTKSKKFLESEKVLHSVLGKKFYYKKDLKSGHVLKHNDLQTAVVRSDKGITPEHYYTILNKKLKNNIKKNALIEFKDLDIGY
jgi:sialic acid synthase SpsE